MSPCRAVGLCVALLICCALILSPVHNPYQRLLGRLGLQRGFDNTLYAFATFLCAGDNSTRTIEEPVPEDSAEVDGYYLSVRVLSYQLLHQPSTRTISGIPFLVFATPDVSSYKLSRLAADGATVIHVESIVTDWIKPDQARWNDVLTKLRLVEETDYTKVCFIDADMLLTNRLDDIFLDPATGLQPTKMSEEALPDHEAELPLSYAFAGVPDAWTYDHSIPPSENNEYTFNSGFFVVSPSKDLFSYYTSLLDEANQEKLMGATFPDQDLLNYAHRRDGHMPWNRLDWHWNANWATKKDLDEGVRSFHAKFWDGDPGHDPTLLAEWERVRDEMRVYYRGMDDAKGRAE